MGSLFTAISNKQVLALKYYTFNNPVIRKIVVHPYLLKEYNKRWFLFVSLEDGTILNFALDRIDGFEPMPHIKYIEPSEDWEERFEEIVGVTLLKDKQAENILLWVSKEQFPYVRTKPLHGTQKEAKGEELAVLRERYASLGEGYFVKLECIPNIELEQLLMSMMDQVVVLAPAELESTINKRVQNLKKCYDKLHEMV